MHVPDGFLDAPTSIATGVVAAVGVGDRAAQGPHRARRPDRADGRPGRGVRLRRPDDELPGRAPAPAATCSAARSPRCSSGRGSPCSASAWCLLVQAPVHGRRRHHRARHQHHPDGARRRLRRLVRVQGRARGAAEEPRVGAARRRDRCPGVGARGRDRRSPLLFAIGGTVPVETSDRARGDGRLAHRHRDRRGRHHRARGRAPWSRPGPTSCTALATCSARASSRSGRPQHEPPRVAVVLPRSSSSSPCSIAGVGSFYASSHPDGLEYVAEQTGFLDSAEDSATADSPFADYGNAGSTTPGSRRDRRRDGVLLVLVADDRRRLRLRRRGASRPQTPTED